VGGRSLGTRTLTRLSPPGPGWGCGARPPSRAGPSRAALCAPPRSAGRPRSCPVPPRGLLPLSPAPESPRAAGAGPRAPPQRSGRLRSVPQPPDPAPPGTFLLGARQVPGETRPMPRTARLGHRPWVPRRGACRVPRGKTGTSPAGARPVPERCGEEIPGAGGGGRQQVNETWGGRQMFAEPRGWNAAGPGDGLRAGDRGCPRHGPPRAPGGLPAGCSPRPPLGAGPSAGHPLWRTGGLRRLGGPGPAPPGQGSGSTRRPSAGGDTAAPCPPGPPLQLTQRGSGRAKGARSVGEPRATAALGAGGHPSQNPTGPRPPTVTSSRRRPCLPSDPQATSSREEVVSPCLLPGSPEPPCRPRWGGQAGSWPPPAAPSLAPCGQQGLGHGDPRTPALGGLGPPCPSFLSHSVHPRDLGVPEGHRGRAPTPGQERDLAPGRHGQPEGTWQKKGRLPGSR